jgi:hypothetical protein
VCISWTIKCLISLMHGCNQEGIFQILLRATSQKIYIPQRNSSEPDSGLTV